MHVVLLRVALALYAVGFAHSVVTVLGRRYAFFRVALYAVVAAFLSQTVSILFRAWELNTMPLTQRYEAFELGEGEEDGGLHGSGPTPWTRPARGRP
jgi:uncharacterized membrane protein